MSVLERLASPLRSRDPAARLRAVQKHPPEDTAALAQLARQDPDPRVRKEAVRRLEAPRVLLELSESAGDEAARRLARSRSESLLVKIAGDDRDLEESRRALALITPLRAVAEVVCRARFEAVREEALARLLASPEGEDGRDAALAVVAGRASGPALRGQALEAIASDSGLLQVAVSAEAREIAQAAVRRLEDPDLLFSVVGSGAPKSVRRLAERRARERMPEDHPERVRERESALGEVLERLAGCDPGTGERGRLLAEAEAVAASGPVDSALADRLDGFRNASRNGAARGAGRQRLVVPVAPPPPAPQPAAARRPVPPEAVEIMTRLEDPEAPLSADAVEAAEREGNRLLEGFAGDAAPRVRLRTAVRDARSRALERKKRRIEEFQLAELADHAVLLAGSLGDKPSESDVVPARRELGRLVRRFEKMPVTGGADAERFQKAARRAEAVVAAAEAAREERIRRSRERALDLDRRLEALEAAEPLPLEEAEAALRDLGALRSDNDLWRGAGAVRQARFQRRQAALLPRLREAREIREWRRWSNLEEQAELIRRARALAAVSDDNRVDRELAGLERAWREARHTGRERGQELWEEWGKVRGALLERVGPLRERAERELSANLDRLAALAAKAEEIADAADPRRAAEMRALMPEWREAAKGVGKKSDRIWKRFREANDRYFAEIKAARKKLVAGMTANIPIREDLIRRAKELSGSSEGDAVRNAVRELMAEWKEAPPVPKKRGDRLWEEFRDACDAARDRTRGVGGNGAPGRDSDAAGEPDTPSAAGGEAGAALRTRVAALSELPAGDRAKAAESLWSEYRRLFHQSASESAPGQTGAKLLTCVRDAFQRAPESFAGTRFDQEQLASRLSSLLESLEPLARRVGPAPTEGGVVTLAEHLQRTLREGRAADRDAELREAAEAAGRLLERARAAGPALAEPAASTRTRIEKLARKIISRAPPPPDGRDRPGRGRSRPPRGRPAGNAERRQRRRDSA